MTSTTTCTVDLRADAARHDALLRRRLDVVVPQVLDRAGLDAWVLVGREYAEDPVLATMLPATWLRTARRRTVLLFMRRPDGAVVRYAVARYAVGEAFGSAWDPAAEDQWACLARLLAEHDPARIGVDRSATWPLGDGLTAAEHNALVAALPDALRGRLVSAEQAAVGWLETRLPEEREVLATACARSHGFLARALSREVVTPGVTTTDDVEWWLRQAVHEAGLGSWFHPSCSVQRAGGTARTSFAAHDAAATIEPGDLVHVDFGIVDAGLCTDQQQHAYVLRPRETAAPAGLVAGVAAANRLQDLLLARFAVGVTGNALLADTLAAAREEGLDGLVYSHPIGVHGHAAGPTIGLWDAQGGVPGQGDQPLVASTAYSIELQARLDVPEWGGRRVSFMLEEDAFFDGRACTFLDGRQTALHLSNPEDLEIRVKIAPFGVEQWMNEYETTCAYNLAETCCESITIEQLLDLAGMTPAELQDQLLPMRMTYGAIEGTDRLRDAVAALYERQTRHNVSIAHGAVGANHLVHHTLVEPGDRVVSVLPTYQQHYSIPESLGAEVRILRLREDAGWLPDLDELADQVRGGAKLVAINNPNNPTGALMDRACLERIAAVCDAAGAWLLCDEVYRGIDGEDPGTTASVADLYERGISTGSTSKAFSLAGLRLGWAVGPAALVQELMIHRDYSTISVGMVDDLLAGIALENADAILRRNRALTRANRATLAAWVDGELRISWVEPRSGTTALLRYDLPIPSRELCVRLVEETGVMLTPGSALGVEGYLRIGYANAPEILADGLARLSGFLRSAR